MHNNYALILSVYLFCPNHFYLFNQYLKIAIIARRKITNSLMKLHKLCKNILNYARKIKFIIFFHILISNTILQLPSKNEVNTLVR